MAPTLLRLLRLLATSTPLRLSVFLLLAIVAAWPALAQAGQMNSFFDAQFLLAYERNARTAVLQYHQWPLWDPYSCGGIYGLAAPQTRYASPTFLLTLLFGVDTGAALGAVLLLVLCMEGMYRYAQSWGASALPAFAWAPAFALCGWFGFVWHFGWFQFFAFGVLPWMLWSFREALRGSRRQSLACALWIAIAVGTGGTYTLPMSVFPVACEVWSALQRHAPGLSGALRRRRVVRGLLATGLLVVGVGAFRLWPLLESAPTTIRVLGGQPTQSLRWALRALFVFAVNGRDEAGHYFLAAPLVLFAFLGRVGWRRAPLWLGLSIALSLVFGHVSPYAPFSLLRKLPVYESLRNPGRYLILVVVSLSLLSALGTGDVLARVRRRFGAAAYARAAVVAVLLCLAGLAAQIYSGHALYADVSTEPSPEVREGVEFRQSRGNRWLMSHFAPEGLGALACGEAYPVPMSQRLRGDLAQEEYLVDADGAALDFSLGQAVRHAWSPHEIVVDVDVAGPTRLAINQNYHPGWQASVGEVQSFEGLLSVQLPAGAHRVIVRFVPRSGVGGIVVSLLSLLAGLLYAYRPPGARWQRVGLLLTGPATLACLCLAWREAPPTRPVPRTASHEPVLLDAVPPLARRLDVHFDVPLVIEAGRVPSRTLARGMRVVDLDLYLRRRGPLAAELALFVHLRGPGGKVVGADHGVLSGVVYLPRMPEGVVVWDHFRALLPANARGEWQVYAGLYDAFGDQTRHTITQTAPGVEVDRNSVWVGSFEVR